MEIKINFIVKYLKDIIFPVFCLECGKEGEWWCKNCLDKIEIQNNLFQTEFSKIKDNPCLDGCVSFLKYSDKNSVVNDLIKQFKYNYISDIKNVWISVFEKVDLNTDIFNNSLILPIPLHSRRKRERGFNQSEILANIISDKFKNRGIKIEKNKIIFSRNRYTKQQAKLIKEERLKNVENAFECKILSDIPEKIILVDDVCTTGATLEECAKVLKKNGVKQVFAFTLAHG